MKKLDLTIIDKSYYSASLRPEIISFKPMLYLSISGQGDPDEDEFASDIQALYPVAYALKFSYKNLAKDFTVPKLEGQWWFDEEKYQSISIQEAPKVIPRSEWYYRLLIRMPDFIKKEDIIEAKQIAMKKKDNHKISKVAAYELHEDLCIQMMHIGPFSKEPESLELIQQFFVENQLLKNGLHHEIYLSDFRKTAPEKLRTILREPVKKM